MTISTRTIVNCPSGQYVMLSCDEYQSCHLDCINKNDRKMESNMELEFASPGLYVSATPPSRSMSTDELHQLICTFLINAFPYIGIAFGIL